MSYVMDGVLGLDFFRYSSNILQTPESAKNMAPLHLNGKHELSLDVLYQLVFGHYLTLRIP